MPAHASDHRELIYTNQNDETNKHPFRLTGDPSFSWNATTLLDHSLTGTGILFPTLYIVSLICSLLLAYFLTISLSKRVFLLGLKRGLQAKNQNILLKQKKSLFRIFKIHLESTDVG